MAIAGKATKKATKKTATKRSGMIGTAAEAKRAEAKQARLDAVLDRGKPNLWLAGQYKGIVSIPGWASGESGNNGPSALYSTSPWAKACIDMRANALAQIEWGIFDANNEELETHELIDLLNRVDMEQNWNDLIRSTVCDLMIHGQAFWQKGYAGRGGAPFGIKRLNAGTMEVEAGAQGIAGFVQQLDATRTPFKREEVVFFHDFDPDNDLGGLSPADVAKASIEIENYADRYLTSFFRNRAVPDVAYETEQELNDGDYARIKRNLKKFKGPDNQHKSMLMEKGMKINVISFPLTDLALDTVRLEARRSICAVFGVPMSLIGADPSANFATADNERKSLYTEHVLPQAEYLASVINSELVADFDPSLYFAWKADELPIMQPDAVSEAGRFAVLVEKGIITPLCAALELGFSEEDVPKKPVIGAPNTPPQPGVTPPALAPFAEATQQVGQAEKPELLQKDADMKRWMRKALAKVKAGKSAAVEFESRAISNVLKAAIMGQLDVCETADEVRHVFNQDMSQPAGMLTTDQWTKAAEAMRPPPPIINNIMPEQKPAVVYNNVTVEGTTVKAAEQSPPIVNINIPPQEPPVVNNIIEAPIVNVPKLAGSTEQQTVKRDAQGNIITTEAETEFHYEGE